VPVVRVVVVHTGSGTDWVTLAVAIAGVILSLAALAWQAFSFSRSGHRVRVEAVMGMVSADPENKIITLPTELGAPQPDWQSFAEQGFVPVIFATIRNLGRLAVTVHECQWASPNGGSITVAWSDQGDSFPRRLEAGDQCEAVCQLSTLSSFLATLNKLTGESSRKIFAVASLGTGGAARSEPVEVPDLPLPKTPPASPGAAPGKVTTS
jgi:hypothetical protein